MREKVILFAAWVEADARNDHEEAAKIDDKIKILDKEIADLTKAEEYRIQEDGNVIQRIERAFATFCVKLQKNNFQNPEKMTVFKFYNALELLNTKPKKNG